MGAGDNDFSPGTYDFYSRQEVINSRYDQEYARFHPSQPIKSEQELAREEAQRQLRQWLLTHASERIARANHVIRWKKPGANGAVIALMDALREYRPATYLEHEFRKIEQWELSLSHRDPILGADVLKVLGE